MLKIVEKKVDSKSIIIFYEHLNFKFSQNLQKSQKFTSDFELEMYTFFLFITMRLKNVIQDESS